jgi:cytochrome oxidase assembly protein ShyY1
VSGWSFALSKRWFGYLALVVVFSIACCLFSWWQFNRRAEAREEIDRIDSNYSSEAVPIDEVLPDLDSFAVDQKWTPVTVTGTYLVDSQVLVRNRPLDGNAGFEVLTPLQRADGTVFIIDRGWVAPGSKQDYPDSIPAAPTGEVTVEARLKAGEPTLPGRSAPEGQIATIQLDDLAQRIGEPTYTGAYGLMASETPAADIQPRAIPKPVRDEGPHLSYALQWIVFAILAFIGLGWALRQEYRVVNAEDPDEKIRAEERRKKDAARTRTDAEVEDALLDA